MHLKSLGIFALLIAIVMIATLINGSFVAPANLKTLVRDTSLYGLISIGVALVIMTGGIDLSIGSMIALCSVMFVYTLDIHFETTDYQSRVTAIDRDGEFQAIALEEPPDIVRDGDRLVYAGTSGKVRLGAYRLVQRGGMSWVEMRDALGPLRPGITVRLERLAHRPVWLVGTLVLGFASLLGLVHGLLVTLARLQPFIVTLCGLMIYRGLARVWTGDRNAGLGTALSDWKQTITGAPFQIPMPWVGRLSGQSEQWSDFVWIDFPLTGVILALVAVTAWMFLGRTVWGRHLLATGENEQAARYSGVPTKRLTVLAYVGCGFLAGLTSILVTFEWNSVQPTTTGQYYELYAIAAAVLGGCSLRGGRGAIVGVIVGTAVIRCLSKANVVLGIPDQFETVIIGMALLASVSVDEVIRWVGLRRERLAVRKSQVG